MRPGLFMYTLVPPSYRCLISNLALIGQAVSETKIFELYGDVHVRGASKKFVDFVNKIKSTYAISLKLPYVCDQFNTNNHRKFQTNRLINVVAVAI